MPFLFDPTYLLFVLIPTLIISGLAQLYIRSSYNKWGQTPNSSGLNGPRVAERLMRRVGLNAGLERTPGQLTDHYDPRDNTVHMSESVADRPSVASMAITAHELGHAQQYAEGSFLIQARSFLLPAVQISPMFSYGLILVGLLFNLTGLAWVGVAFFGVTVLFMLLTLPVEIDASLRGLRMLDASGLMASAQDRQGAQQMLTAAALTYVAAAVTAVLQLLYYVSLVSSRD